METRHFRLDNKKILLTYPQANVGMSSENMLIHFKRVFQKAVDFKYIIVAREKHQDGGEHYHIYIEAREAVKSRSEKIFDMRIGDRLLHPNIEKVLHTPWKTVEYVMKDGEYTEYLQENRPKCSLANMNKSEKNKYIREADPLELYENDMLSAVQTANLIKAKRTIQYYQLERTKKRAKPVVLWFHGDTGTGKTRTAIEIAEEAGCEYWISHGEKLQWFDGYVGQEYAIIDDFRRNMCTFNYLLRLLDRYTLQVPVKGGFTNWIPKVIIITCPVTSREAWQWTDKDGEVQDWDSYDQLKRRIDDEIKFN